MSIARPSPAQLLEEIQQHRRDAPLAILSLAEPLLTPTSPQPSTSLNPATLIADLAHYRDLFSKLRFSYLEQVTKEKYLRSIVGEPPLLATSAENAALEEKLAVLKADLQTRKRNVEALIEELNDLAGQIAEKYDSVDVEMRKLETLPIENEEMEAEIDKLRQVLVAREGDEVSDDPLMNMSLEDTEREIDKMRKQDEELRREIDEMQRELPRKTEECEIAQKELKDVERKRNEVTRLARDAQMMREGGRDRLEEQGRWYQSSEVVLKGLLGVES